MTNNGLPTSRRNLLRTLAIGPMLMPHASNVRANTPTDDAYLPAPVLRRTREGRLLSRSRYHNAEHFFTAMEPRAASTTPDLLYRSGIVAQLGLSAYLLDVGFDDRWCARYIGLRVAKSLSHARENGFDSPCPAMVRLADILTPYSKWAELRPPSFDLAGIDVLQSIRTLLDQVYYSTGHPRPRRWRRNNTAGSGA